MKIINASIKEVGSNERKTFPLPELLVEGTIDPVKQTIIKRGTPYDLNTLQWEILDAPVVLEQPVEPVVSPDEPTSETQPL
ncbi:MAG: hypothetical protein HY840_07900 [Bacteroidetes bacterium]|nr:hypothetical protein [Bacteroidota bacterium]